MAFPWHSEQVNTVDQPLFDIQLANDGRTVWVTAADGSCVGRFSKTFGLDVHTTVTEQMSGKAQCLYCTHAPAGRREWSVFRAKVLEHHQIDVPADFIRWS